jgi:predicted MFS family arabinose efflux permease
MQNASGDTHNLGAATKIWTGNLLLLASATFMVSFGTGLINGASTNFFVNTLGLSGAQVLWLAGIREIPGLILMFIAALVMHLPLSRRAAVSVLLMGVGYGLYTLVHSYTALIAMALIASLGFHNWMPLSSSLALGLAGKQRSGRVMGVLSSVGALASIVGVGMIAVFARLLSLRSFFTAGGLLMVVAAVLLARLPTNLGETKKAQPRLLFRRRYWLYYVLTLFEGSRTQVFGTFGTLVLVQEYGLDARATSLLLLASSTVNFLAAPLLGHLLDRLGERLTLSGSYVLLALCFVGYATVHNAWFLGAMLIGINLLVMLSIGLSTYVHRLAPPEELTPTLSTGVSVNHITSVSMSLLAGTLLKLVGYENLCWGAAAIIMLSVPFALAIRARPITLSQPRPVAAE